MLKQLLTKTLLVAAGLCTGMSAWADDYTKTTTTYDFVSTSTNPFTFTGRGSIDINDNNLHFTSANNAGNAAPGAFAYFDFSDLTKTAVKVDVSFDCYLPSYSGQLKVSLGDATQRPSSIFTGKGAWSYNGTGAIFVFGTERGKLNGSTNENYASVNGNAIGSTTTLKANEVLGLWVTINITADVANKKVSYTMKNKSTNATLVSATDAAWFNANAATCTQIDIQTGVNSVNAYIDNLSITSYVDASEKYADYTIKYMYGNTEIKTARTVESIKVGNTTSILDTDKAAIWYGNPSEKYIYSSDDADEQTVAEDGSTVVTVSFRKANTENYTLNAINSADNSLLGEIASGTLIEGESSTVYYHKAVQKDGVWYVRNQNTAEPYYGINVVAGTNTVAYTANPDVKYFFEVEDLPVVKKGGYDGWRNDGMAGRSSNGVAPRHYGKNYAYTEVLDPGIYTLSMNARNQSSSVSDNVTLALMDEDGVITPLEEQFVEWAKAVTAEKTVSVSIPAGKKFVLQCGNNNSNLNMDFLMFTRTGDYTVSKSISAAGWATYCSPYPLDFEGTGLTAYIVTGADADKLEKEEVTTVPANTGVLLKGDAGDYNISVVASSSTDVTDNKMVGVTAETQLAPTGGWVLMGSPSLGFYCNTNEFTLGANTAYIPVDEDDFKTPPTEGAKTRFFSLDGEDATAINGIESEKNADNAAIYNLAGQRVNGGYKGIVIKNGKKVLVK